VSCFQGALLLVLLQVLLLLLPLLLQEFPAG
jgi:hypothetical protein